ncbi:hypothetical protein CLOM_g17158 [Closterium sp. NIES-68]|nr:hypothetical protein CLOM_g17158 [Closterium sp. NIES-68]GJP63174.1 hypothetical protein CLOP_g20243 [Closterium sp. NIES-67]
MALCPPAPTTCHATQTILTLRSPQPPSTTRSALSLDNPSLTSPQSPSFRRFRQFRHFRSDSPVEPCQWLRDYPPQRDGCRFLGSRWAVAVATSASQSDAATPVVSEASSKPASAFIGLHHVGILCEDLDKALDFYCGVLGLEVNDSRPNQKLPYGGKWLWIGQGEGSRGGMIHLMVLPNPDPTSGRPEHGGRDRHTCIEVADVAPLQAALDRAGIPYTMSQSGRPAVFCRDPDGNALEFAQF